MNEDNNEAGGWTCESEGATALFEGEVPPEACQEKAKCSWCILKEETYTWRGLNFKDQHEWEEHVSEEKEKLEAKAKEVTNGYLVDGIAKLNELKCRGLDAHNKSIELCIDAFTDIFNMGVDDQNSVMTKQYYLSSVFESGQIPAIASMTTIWAYDDTSDYDKPEKKRVSIEFRGKESGIKYKISIIYKHNRARKLANRIDELVQANSLYPVSESVLRGFVEASDFLGFQVNREDEDGGWDYLCIEPSGDFGVWPGDDIATLIMCLNDDLNTALDPAMYTLRHGLQEASKVAFLNGNSKSSIHRLVAYEAAFKRIKEATKKMKTENVLSLSSRLKSNFSDPEYARESPLDGVDYEMLQDEAWEAEWNEGW